MVNMARMFPLINGTVWGGLLHIDNYFHALYSDEKQLMEGCSEKRIKDFSTGRVLARALLTKLGVKAGSIMPGQCNAPVWPPGVAGSVSHSGTVCFVVVSRHADSCIGIDVQKLSLLEKSLVSALLTKEEQAAVCTLPGIDRNTAANLIFSAKECVYKCLAHTVAADMDFHDAVITIGRGSFTAAIQHLNVTMEGRFFVYGNYVFTGIIHVDLYRECQQRF